jgi:hypothetical protein
MRIDPIYDLAIQIQNEAKDAMGSRMLRTKIDREFTIVDIV